MGYKSQSVGYFKDRDFKKTVLRQELVRMGAKVDFDIKIPFVHHHKQKRSFSFTAKVSD